MIDYEDIDEFVDALFIELVKEHIFNISVEQNLVIVNADFMRNILRSMVESMYYQRIGEESADPDKMADLQILLWQIKQEKRNSYG